MTLTQLIKVDTGPGNGLPHRHAIIETDMVGIDSCAKAVPPECGEATGFWLELNAEPSLRACSPLGLVLKIFARLALHRGYW